MRIRNPKYMKCNIELSDETKIITIRNFWAKVIDGYNNNSLISNPNKNGALHNGPCALKIRTTINNNDMRIIENQKREIGESIKNLIESHKPKGFVNTEYKLFSEFKYKNKEYYAVTYIKKIIR